MYSFGRWSQDLSRPLEIISRARSKEDDIKETSIDKIIDVLDLVGEAFKNSKLPEKLLSSGFDSKMNTYIYSQIPEIFNKKNIKRRLRSEFVNLKCLDEFSSKEKYFGEIHYQSLGVVLHITAGNIILGALDSLVMGLITKNISILKITDSHQEFFKLFCEIFNKVDTEKVLTDKFAIFYWKGGDHPCEKVLKNNVDGVIAWGGDNMVSSLKKDLSSNVKFIEHGPKLSFHIITKAYDLVSDAKAIVQDIAFWDQNSCANSQNIYLEESINKIEFKRKLEKAFQNFEYEKSKITEDQRVEDLKEYNRSLMFEFQGEEASVLTDNYSISFDKELTPRSSNLGRHIIIKTFSSLDELKKPIKSFKKFLQTCGLGASYSEYIKLRIFLSRLGVNRITSPGKMLQGLSGSPHDGNFSLLELTQVHCDEAELLNPQDKCIDDISTMENGIVFATGGTTGTPKYSFFTKDEFRKTCYILAESYENLGLNKQDRVLNLFMAGNLWSSFSAIQYALDELDVIQFPLGGNASNEQIAALIKRFNINVIFGIPSKIMELEGILKNNIDKIFYAGEKLSEKNYKYLKNELGVGCVYSAGYATVDIGPIGYQTQDCKLNEHYLFSDLIELTIENGEGVITSKVKKSIPIIAKKTGDKIKVISKKDDKTKFRLEGRVDKMIFIWSSRISFSEINELIGDENMQIIIENVGNKFDKMLIKTQKKIDHQEFLNLLHAKSADLNETHHVSYLTDKIEIKHESPTRNERSQKIPAIIDLR